TDQFPTDIYNAVFCIYEVLKMGGFTTGGMNFDAHARRGSFTPEDLFYAHAAGMDGYALGLKIAHKLLEDKFLEDFIAKRYESYQSGIGKKIVDGTVGFKELE